MKIMKKTTSLFLALILIFATFATSGISVNAQVYSGDYSRSSQDSVMWSFDSSTGTLTFSGEGHAESGSYWANSPWSQFEENIDRVIIENGVSCSLSLYNCKNISSIEIGKDVLYTPLDSLNPKIFPNLKSIYVDESNTYCSSTSGVLFVKPIPDFEDLILLCYPSQKKENTYSIPTGVTEIGKFAFYNCMNLETITIPDSVEKIDREAFKNSKLYTDTTNWENGVLYIDDCLIEVDPNFKGTLEVRPGTRLIAEDALTSCSGITDLVIPESLKHFNSQNFSNNEYSQFKENNALYLGSCLIKVYSSSDSTDFTVKDGTQLLAEQAFLSCDVKSVTIPKSVTVINYLASSDITTINYNGTRYEWSQIKIYGEDFYDITINCTDGVYDENVLYENTPENSATQSIPIPALVILVIVIVVFFVAIFFNIKNNKKDHIRNKSKNKEYKTLQ